MMGSNTIYGARYDITLNMVVINVEMEIDAPADRVWDVVSNIDNEPKFWKGTKEIRNISRNGNITNREITIAFRDQKCMQQVELFPKEKIDVRFTSGIIKGKKIITLVPRDEKTVLQTIWDIKLTGMMSMFTGMIKGHIRGGTEQAMRDIKGEIE